MPGIGDVRVNLIADVASFVTNVQKGSRALAGFGKDAAKIVSDIDRTIGMFGRKATLKITAPLVGLAAAAVNAADPTKRVFNELERLGLQAGKALEPVGDILISLFDRALPYVQSAVGGLRELSNRFAALPPATQEMAIGAAAAVAAIEVVSAKIAKIMEELKKLEDKTKETFGYKMSKAVEGFAGRASDTLAEFLIDGKTDLEAFLKSFEKTMLSTMFNSAIFQPAFSWLGGAFSLKGGSALTAPAASGIGVVAAHGGAFSNGMKLNAFASGGVLNSPTMFPMRSGFGLAGERGPEAIAPLTRIGGDLGIKAVPPQISFQVIDQRGRGAPVQVSEQSRGDGTRQIQVLIRDEVNSGLASGAYDTTLNRVFGVRRRGY